jgi:hypothetical protein
MNSNKDFYTPSIPMAPGVFILPIGRRDFDIVAGLFTRLRPALIVCQLAQVFRGDFECAGGSFDSCEHQVLLAAADYSVFRLIDPSFDAADALCCLLETDDAIDRITAHPIGRSIRIQRVVDALTTKLTRFDPDGAKALWASLSFAQNAALSDFERMTAEWWMPEFITMWRPFGEPESN